MTKKDFNSKNIDSNYVPRQRIYIKKIKVISNRQDLNSRTWNIEEEKLYLEYLSNHKDNFKSVETRKKLKVFISMSMFLKTRTSDQCRSHHQKMIKKYGDTDSIVKGITLDKLQTEPPIKESQVFQDSLSEKVNPMGKEFQKGAFESAQPQLKTQKILSLKLPVNSTQTSFSLSKQTLNRTNANKIRNQIKSTSMTQSNDRLWELLDQNIWVDPFP